MAPQTFKVLLSRKTGETEQHATVLVTAKSKKAAADLALGRAENDDATVEWEPRLPEDVTPGETIDVISCEKADSDGSDAQVIEGADTSTTEVPEDVMKSSGTAGKVTSGHGTQGGVARGIPDLPGLGTFGTRVDARYGTHTNMTEAQLKATADKDKPPAPRAQSAAELASPPGCGTVKKALGNAESNDRGGRVLDVQTTENGDDASDAETQSAADVAKDQGHT